MNNRRHLPRPVALILYLILLTGIGWRVYEDWSLWSADAEEDRLDFIATDKYIDGLIAARKDFRCAPDIRVYASLMGYSEEDRMIQLEAKQQQTGFALSPCVGSFEGDNRVIDRSGTIVIHRNHPDFERLRKIAKAKLSGDFLIVKESK